MNNDEGFFTRWSRRKSQPRGVPAGEEAVGDPRVAAITAPHEIAAPPSPVVGSGPVPAAGQEAGLTLPTMDDVARLTPTSDFSRFVGAGVDAGVQRAALKTLFSDPHFNVMDGLDTYIDDYNKADPIPDAMLRRLHQSKVMQLFEAVPLEASDVASAQDVQIPIREAVTQCPLEASPDGEPAPALPPSAAAQAAPRTPESSTDEDIALRLQPDDAADAADARSHRAGPRA